MFGFTSPSCFTLHFKDHILNGPIFYTVHFSQSASKAKVPCGGEGSIGLDRLYWGTKQGNKESLHREHHVGATLTVGPRGRNKVGSSRLQMHTGNQRMGEGTERPRDH